MARYSGPVLRVTRESGWYFEEPLRDDLCRQVERFLLVAAALPGGELTWEVVAR